MKYLILVLIFAASSAFAELPAPAWLNQIKLSGLSGPVDHRLAVINRKTFSVGEDADLKLKSRTVHVQCLEIREQSRCHTKPRNAFSKSSWMNWKRSNEYTPIRTTGAW